jgi:hypothetical protein
MRRWFLSYHSPDEALAERLKAAIERKDAASRVFFAPTHMRAGGSWSAQLAQEIADATAFILLIGERVGPWQVLEYDEALDKWAKSPSDFPLIVVLLEGQTAPGLPFLRRLHWIITPDPASEKDIARLCDAASGGGISPGELWRYTSPYRGLPAMEEKDSDYFFGRGRETFDVLSALGAKPNRLPVLIGNSGVGKSSLAQAGVLAALKRQAWPEDAGVPNAWPRAFEDSRRWCFLTLKPDSEPLKALVGSFLDTWQFGATDPERVKQQNGWIDLLRDGKASLRDLLDATERRHSELGRSKPPSFFLYIDQGEELYVRAGDRQGRRFSEILADGLPEPRLRAMMSMRSDFLGELQKDEALYAVHWQINIPPLRETELRNVVSRPADLLSARFETPGLVDIISRRTAEDSVKDVGALPLLSYTLDDMWTQMVKRGDGVLRLPAQSFELGGVLVDRANKFLETHVGIEGPLRRVLTLRLATVREDGEPTGRRAPRSEFSDVEWGLVSELADHPNRLLVTITAQTGETYAEVAHEAIFRRWDKLRGWIASESEFLVWRGGLEAARRAWQVAPNSSKRDALLMGFALKQAQSWLAKRSMDLPATDRDFIALSRKATQRRRWGVRAIVGMLAIGTAVSLLGWFKEAYDHAQVERQFRAGLIEFKEAQTRLAAYSIPREYRDRIGLAAHLVIIRDAAGNERGDATAFPIGPHLLATAAHVAENRDYFKPGDKMLVRAAGPNGRVWEVVEDTKHPSYKALDEFLSKNSMVVKSAKSTNEPSGLIPFTSVFGYDVAILRVEGPPLSPILELATPEEIAALRPGDPLAYAGYPQQDIIGAAVNVLGATPQVRTGLITALTDFFTMPADATQLRLVHHNMGTTVGTSGSPIISTSGRVVALHTRSGYMGVPGGKVVPSGAPIGYAQRSDMIADLLSGKAAASVDLEKVYWEKQTAKLLRGQDAIVASLLDGFKPNPSALPTLVNKEEDELEEQDRATTRREDGTETVTRQKIHQINVRGSSDHAFIAYADDGAPINLYLFVDKKLVKSVEGQSWYPGLTYRVPRDRTVEVYVSGLDDDVSYTLFHYVFE